MHVHHELQKTAANRYFDNHMGRWTVKLLPGEFAVDIQGDMIVTVLGSCISTCIRDKKLGIGGMNHFMLPSSGDGEWGGVSASTRYGNYAMEHLINVILANGGSRTNLEAKIFGGGDLMGATAMQVGENNAEFARKYLRLEGIKILGEDIGGAYSRKLYYSPKDGKVMMKKLKVLKNDTVKKREEEYRDTLAHTKIESEIELF